MPFKKLPEPDPLNDGNRGFCFDDPELSSENETINSTANSADSDPFSSHGFPVFLFGPITGDYISMSQLATLLQAVRQKKSPIYMWTDPTPSPSDTELSNFVQKLAKEIIKKTPWGPIFLGGYSWGGILTSLVSDQLILMGRKVAPFIIDTGSPGFMKDYLQTEAAKFDLIEIFNYVGAIAGWSHNYRLPSLTAQASEMKEINDKSINEQLAYLKNKLYEIALLSKNTGLVLTLEHIVNITIHNLLRLMQYKPMFVSSDQRPAKMGFCSSEASESKHGRGVLAKSWEKHCKNLEAAPPINTDHISIVRDEEPCSELANHMAKFYSHCFSKEEISAIMMDQVIKNNPVMNNVEFLLRIAMKHKGEELQQQLYDNDDHDTEIKSIATTSVLSPDSDSISGFVTPSNISPNSDDYPYVELDSPENEELDWGILSQLAEQSSLDPVLFIPPATSPITIPIPSRSATPQEILPAPLHPLSNSTFMQAATETSASQSGTPTKRRLSLMKITLPHPHHSTLFATPPSSPAEENKAQAPDDPSVKKMQAFYFS